MGAGIGVAKWTRISARISLPRVVLVNRLSSADARVQLVQLESNSGVGRAITAGYAQAFAAGADVAVVMAGDGQMDPLDMPALLDPITTGRAAYAKGNRLSYPDARRRMPWTRCARRCGSFHHKD